MCFRIRISIPFHLAIQKVSIQNLNCPKNACAGMIFIPALRSEDWAGIKIMSAHAFLAFLGQLRFWMDTFWIARWNGLKILIPKHMWKSKIRPLELTNDKKSRKYLFFRDTLYIIANLSNVWTIYMIETVKRLTKIKFGSFQLTYYCRQVQRNTDANELMNNSTKICLAQRRACKQYINTKL